MCVQTEKSIRSVSYERHIQQIEAIRQGWMRRLHTEFKHLRCQWYVSNRISLLERQLDEKEMEMIRRGDGGHLPKMRRIIRGTRILQSL